jgi:hypothetical protein
MKRVLLAAGALALAALLAAGSATAQSVPLPKAQGGNKALMEDWVRKKRALRDQVYQDLSRKGLLPRDGTVSFEALVKPDPKNPDKVTVKLGSLAILERPKGQSAQNAAKMDGPIFGPRNPSGRTEMIEASIPVGGVTYNETITIVGGKPQEQKP